MPTNAVTELIRALSSQGVEVVDLTQPLSESTPVIDLPEPYVNSPGLSRRELARYDERNPLARWDVLELGEHTGTHVDAPIHWITGRGGKDIASIEVERLVGPAVVIDKSAEVAKDPGYLLTLADLEAFEADHGEIPSGAWVLFRADWDKRINDKERFLNVGPDGPVTPGPDVAASMWLAAARDKVMAQSIHEIQLPVRAPAPAVDNERDGMRTGTGRHVQVPKVVSLRPVPVTPRRTVSRRRSARRSRHCDAPARSAEHRAPDCDQRS